MQITLELPNIIAERLKTFPAPNEFIIKVLAQTLNIDSKSDIDAAYSIEDAFGLYKPKRSVSLEDMEQAIKKGAIK